MELIRILETRSMKNNNGVNSWGEFLCSFCLQLVERTLSSGRVAKSCGCMQYKLASESKTGQKRTDEAKQKISKANKGKKRSEEQNRKQSEIRKGKKLTEITKQKMRENHANVDGKNNPMYGKKGVLSSNWRGGTTFEEYPQEFNKELKKQILERDDYTCQNPNCYGNHKKLHIHHIDYDKKNNNPKNLLTLCISCHSKTNLKNRNYWTNYYQNIVINVL